MCLHEDSVKPKQRHLSLLYVIIHTSTNMLKVIPAMLVLIRWECPFVSCVTADNSPCSVFTCCRSQALLMPIGFFVCFFSNTIFIHCWICCCSVFLSFTFSLFCSSQASSSRKARSDSNEGSGLAFSSSVLGTTS